MRNRIISTLTACALAATLAAITYRIGKEDGEDRVLDVVCSAVDQQWDRQSAVCR
ncbi:hypothetical protein [Microbacterium allomyrinae]|uniref:Uncharacterized protein n=1 Tax=Microbacterium allomyrinae TaxID=2830666 RepID=A0A9X1LWR4_9MICO|nr:hypothetical protein [Microbacterium allomyrinae]MCC2033053.1 hypothetical protein [Microbacterium allomyrinae]